MSKTQCPNCGKTVRSDLTICPYCGYQIVESLETANGNHKQKTRHVVLWIVLAIMLVLVIVLVALCLLAPENPISATIINLLVSAKDIFTFNLELLILTGALIVLLFCTMLYRFIAAKRGRKIHAREWAEEQELVGSVIVADAMIEPQQIYDAIVETLNDRKTRKAFLPKGNMTFSTNENGVVHGFFYHRLFFSTPDRFKIAITFQALKSGKRRTYLEIVQWEERNGVATKICIQAMKGIGNLLKTVILRMDSQAQIDTYSR